MKSYAKTKLQSALETFDSNLRLAGEGSDAEAIHDLRVSIRRLQESLRIFAPCLPCKRRKKLRKRLKAVMEPAGQLRNRDIAGDLVRELGGDPAHVQADKGKASHAMQNALEKAARKHVAAKAQASLKSRCDARDLIAGLPAATEEYFEAGRKAMRPGVGWDDTHQFRLLTKRYRYTLELCSDLFPEEIDARLEKLKEIQTLLGDANDAVVTQKMVDDEHLKTELQKLARRKVARARSFWREHFSASGESDRWSAWLMANANPEKMAAI